MKGQGTISEPPLQQPSHPLPSEYLTAPSTLDSPDLSHGTSAAPQGQSFQSDHPSAQSEEPVAPKPIGTLPSPATKMNEFLKGSRTKEKVILRYGEDSISVVKQGDSAESPNPNNKMGTPNQEETQQHDTSKQGETRQHDISKQGKTQQQDDAQAEKPSSEDNTRPTSYADQIGAATTVEGWQAFADEKARAAQPDGHASHPETNNARTATEGLHPDTNDAQSKMNGETFSVSPTCPPRLR